MRYLITTLFLVIITACSSIQHIPAKEKDIEKVFYSKADYLRVWGSIQNWIISENIPVSKLDQESGFLFAEYWPNNMSSIIDCGQVKGRMGFSTAKMQDINVKLTVILVQQKEDTKISINVFGEGSVAIRDMATERQLSGSTKMHCVSTGKLEISLKNFLSQAGFIE